MTAAGSWTDRRGPTSPLLVGVGLFVVGLLVAGFAPTMVVLVVGRIVQGVGSDMLIVALYVVVARVYPEPVRPRVFAAFAAAMTRSRLRRASALSGRGTSFSIPRL